LLLLEDVVTIVVQEKKVPVNVVVVARGKGKLLNPALYWLVAERTGLNN